MNLKYALYLAIALVFWATPSAQAYTYGGSYGSGGGYSGSSGYYMSRYGNTSSGYNYSSTWRGSYSNYVGYSSGSGSYFGVPTSTTFGSYSPISRKHRGQYKRELAEYKKEQTRLNNLPPPCGLYGRRPKSCPVARFDSVEYGQ